MAVNIHLLSLIFIIMHPTLLLLTHAPDHPLTAQGLEFAREFCQQWQHSHPNKPIALQIFCYSDAVLLANRLIWRPADVPNLAKDWQQLAVTYELTVEVCVSTALARGVTDSDNAKRHGLLGENLAQNFCLVGLGELAMHLHQHSVVKQF